MADESRKATDVLLSLEEKITNLLSMVSSLNLQISVMSNKLNNLAGKGEVPPVSPKFTIEPVINNPKLPVPKPPDDGRHIFISADNHLTAEKQPDGFRRTSRPETFAGDNSYLPTPPPKAEPMPKFPMQVPRGNKVELISSQQQKNIVEQHQVEQKPVSTPSANKIPVSQRLTDKSGKALFLADIEIVDPRTGEQIVKTKTNAAGKWSAVLSTGTYKVNIRKLDLNSKNHITASQTVSIDGAQSPLILNAGIIS